MPQLINAAQQVAFGAQGSAFGAYTALAMAASAKTALPLGWNYVITDADDTVQITQDAGTTFETVVAASSGGLVWSDGYNVQVVNNGTAGTVHYAQVKGI